MPAPSYWARIHNAALGTAQINVAFIESTTGAGALGADQILNSTDIFTPANGTALTLTKRFHDDPVGRCLGVSLLKSTSAGGYTVRLVGYDQFGEIQQEDITWAAATAAGAALHHIFTRFAYLGLLSVTKIASSGTPNAADRVRIGLSPIGTDFPGTIISPQPNGSSLTQYKGIGLPIPLSLGTDFAGASSALFTSELRGISYTGANVPVALNRGAGFLVDSAYSVFVPQETFVISGAGIYGLILHCQTNRGE